MPDKDLDALIAMELASNSFVATDGHMSIAMHTNEDAAQRVLSSQWLRDVKDEAFSAGVQSGYDVATNEKE